MSRMVICPGPSTAQNYIAAPSPSTNSGGSTVWVLATADFAYKFEDFGTARIRLGFAWGRCLPYLTGGFIYGTIETYYSAATAPRRARAYFPTSGQPAASNMPLLRTSRCPTGGVQSGSWILDPVRHAHGVSYRPRWLEL
jgi:hypothetical protein